MLGYGGRKIAIGEAFFEDFVGCAGMQIEALALAVEFIPAELEPVEAVEDGIERLLGVAFDIGIVDAEDHRSGVVAGVQPIEDKGPGAADVEVSGRRRGETHSEHGNF